MQNDYLVSQKNVWTTLDESVIGIAVAIVEGVEVAVASAAVLVGWLVLV